MMSGLADRVAKAFGGSAEIQIIGYGLEPDDE
jgi:hypothetical protein